MQGLGLWCGNNEIESAWNHWQDFQTETPYLRADYVKLFEDILPDAVKEQIRILSTGRLPRSQEVALTTRMMKTEVTPITGMYGMDRNHSQTIRNTISVSVQNSVFSHSHA